MTYAKNVANIYTYESAQMTIRLYSDRIKDAAKAGQADVYQYDQLSSKLRVQLRRIIRNSFGDDSAFEMGDLKYNQTAEYVRDTVCQEIGRDSLGGRVENPLSDILFCFDHCDVELVLDVLEVATMVLNGYVRKNQSEHNETWSAKLGASEALDEINFRLRDAGVGFQIEGGRLIRVDSQFLHAEAIKPVLGLLNASGFEGPQAEFLAAHEHYRSGRNKEAITEAAKAFESLMKAVCDLKGWTYESGARSSDLLKVLRSHHLWPDYLDGTFDQLVATLASGLPKVRNESAAHGQGSIPKTVPSYVAAYALHLAASTMVLIVEAAEITK